jgi:V8-like Glu-specific endopeptidase
MPLTNVEICERVKAAAWRVIIVDEGPPHRLISFGTAFAISPSGLLLTARHVVSTGRKFFANPLHCHSNDASQLLQFEVITGADLSIDTGARDTKPLPIDLAVLTPYKSDGRRYGHIPLRRDLLRQGDDVIVAGYAKDITYPFFIDEHVDTRTLEGMELATQLKRGYGLRQLFFKKTMVGVAWNLSLNNYLGRGQTVKAAQYIYGTDLVEGASGGPLVDMDGRVAGVICRTGVNKLENYAIPTTDGYSLTTLGTGSGTALSHQLVTAMFSASDLVYD